MIPSRYLCSQQARIGRIGASLVLALTFALPSWSATVGMSGSPKNWRLESYVSGSGVVLWFTGSPCTNGRLDMPNASEAEKNRLWSLILTAKTSGKNVFVYYDNANAPAACPIVSFGIDE